MRSFDHEVTNAELEKPITHLFYKKESQDAPKHIIETGRKRIAAFREKRKKD